MHNSVANNSSINRGAAEGTYVYITDGAYNGKFGRIKSTMRDNRFQVELVHHNGSCMHEEISGQKINTRLRDTFFTVLCNVESKNGDDKINLNIALDNFKCTSANGFHLNSVSSYNPRLETPIENNKIEDSDNHSQQKFLYIKRGENAGSFGWTESAPQKRLTVTLIHSNGSCKTSDPQNKPISVIVEEGCVAFLENVVLSPTSGGHVDLRASYERQYGTTSPQNRPDLRNDSASLLSASSTDSTVTAPSDYSATQPTSATQSTLTESSKDSSDGVEQEPSPRRAPSSSRSHELTDRIVLLTKGKFAGSFGKILSSDDLRHRIYLVNSDKSIILNRAREKKREKRSCDYLKSSCLVLPDAQTVSDLDELKKLLPPAEQESFQYLRTHRVLSQSQDDYVQIENVSAPSSLRREHGEQSSATQWSLKSSGYAIISGGPWFGHFGRIQRRTSGTGRPRYLLYIVNRSGDHVFDEHKEHHLTAHVPWSQLIALSVPSIAMLDLDVSLERLGTRVSFLRNRRAAIEKHIENNCWMHRGDSMHLLDKVLEDIIWQIECETTKQEREASDSMAKASTKALEEKPVPERNEGDKEIDFFHDIDTDTVQAEIHYSEPRSGRVYQPSPSQRQPALSQIRGRMASHQNRCDSEDSDDEARNNLYFVEGMSSQQASSQSSETTFTGRFFCLCYTNRTKIDHGDVEVIPIGLPFLEGWGGGSDFPAKVVSVARNRLRPLDPPLVRKHCGSNELAGEYLLALMCFADWDNFSASSFMWPSNIVKLFQNASATDELCRQAVAHPLSSSPYGKSCLSKVILFHLCANHLGILDSFDMHSFLSRGESTQEIAHLLSQLSAVRVNDDENCVQRTASRVGADYQATLPALQVLSKEVDSVSESTFRCYSYRECNAKKFEDKCMVEYLGAVQELREKFLSPGHLVEIPIAVQETAAHVEKYSKEPIKDHVPKYFDTFALNNGLVDLRCMKKKSVTAFGFVKEYKPAASAALIADTATPCATELYRSKSMEDGDCDSLLSVKTRAEEVVCSSSEQSESSAAAVLVKLENDSVQVPFKICRSFLLPVDQALDILYSEHFNWKKARDSVEKVLKDLMESANDSVGDWTTDCFGAKEIDAFYLAFQRYGEYMYVNAMSYDQVVCCGSHRHRRNVRALWTAYNQMVTRIRRGKSKKPSRKAEDIPLDGGARYMSFKRIFHLFTLYFVERDEVSADSLPCPVARRKRAEPTMVSDGEKAKRIVPRDPISSSSSSSGGRPPGWPSSLPLSTHNIYYLKGRNSPCICIDVDVNKEDSIVVLQICTASYNHQQAVPLSTVESFQEDQLQQCFDDRTAPFTVALINFAAWELSNANTHVVIPADSHLRKWYIYPSFVIKMLSHLPLLTEWRKQAERAARNVRADRSVIYYNCLVQKYRSLEEYEINAGGRLDQQGYPWDAAYREKLIADAYDSEASKEDEERGKEENAGGKVQEGSAEGTRCAKSNPVQQLRQHERITEITLKRLRYDSKFPANFSETSVCRAQVRHAEDLGDEGENSMSGVKRSHSEDADTRPAQRPKVTSSIDSKKPPPLITSLNIFWLKRSNLPCIFYDKKNQVASEKIWVLPVCCSTYHYSVQVTRSLIEPLSPDFKFVCNDERTIEFAGALTDFARWHLSSISEKLRTMTSTSCSEDGIHRHYVDVDDNSGTVVRYYIWPSRILNLVTQSKEFSAFRKVAERSKRPGGRRAQYLDALLKLYNDNDNGNSSDSGSENEDEDEGD